MKATPDNSLALLGVCGQKCVSCAYWGDRPLARMDPRSSIAKDVMVLGSALTILGLGTWALVAGPALTLMAPALFGAGFLVIGGLLLRTRDWHRSLLWLSLIIAVAIITYSFDTILEALRTGNGVAASPVAMQQAVAVLLCIAFLCISVRRLVSYPVA